MDYYTNHDSLLHALLESNFFLGAQACSARVHSYTHAIVHPHRIRIASAIVSAFGMRYGFQGQIVTGIPAVFSSIDRRPRYLMAVVLVRLIITSSAPELFCLFVISLYTVAVFALTRSIAHLRTPASHRSSSLVLACARDLQTTSTACLRCSRWSVSTAVPLLTHLDYLSELCNTPHAARAKVRRKSQAVNGAPPCGGRSAWKGRGASMHAMGRAGYAFVRR